MTPGHARQGLLRGEYGDGEAKNAPGTGDGGREKGIDDGGEKHKDWPNQCTRPPGPIEAPLSESPIQPSRLHGFKLHGQVPIDTWHLPEYAAMAQCTAEPEPLRGTPTPAGAGAGELHWHWQLAGRQASPSSVTKLPRVRVTGTGKASQTRRHSLETHAGHRPCSLTTGLISKPEASVKLPPTHPPTWRVQRDAKKLPLPLQLALAARGGSRQRSARAAVSGVR